MPVLGKNIVLRSCAMTQTSRRAHQLVRWYTFKTIHQPRTRDLSLHSSDPSALPAHFLPEKITYTPSSPPTLTDPAPRLSPAAKSGIITACVIVFILLFSLTLELAYFGRQRRVHMIQQAQREVEQGDVELGDVKDGREIKENVVLESRVEIVVEGEEEAQGSSVRGSWGKGWVEEADADANAEVEDWGRERKGMSLPRREY